MATGEAVAPPPPPAATYQSWTGSVALFLPRPPRIALYPTQQQIQPGTGTGAGVTSSTAGVAESGLPAPSQPLQSQPAAGPALAPAPARQPLPPVPGKSALRGSWLLSKGAATLTAALSGAGRGLFELKVQLADTVLWQQDLFGGAGALRLLAPPPASGGSGGTAPAPGPVGASTDAQQLSWMLLLMPSQPHSQAVPTSVGTQGRTQGEESVAAAPSAALVLAAGSEGPAPSAARPPPPALCFRFNSEGEGRAFQSLLEAAGRAREAVLRSAAAGEKARTVAREAAEERRRQRRERREVRQRGRAQPAAAAAGVTARTTGGGGSEGGAAAAAGTLSPSHEREGAAPIGVMSRADIQAAIERYLLEPDFQELVTRVEAVWEEMEAAAERQLAAQQPDGARDLPAGGTG